MGRSSWTHTSAAAYSFRDNKLRTFSAAYDRPHGGEYGFKLCVFPRRLDVPGEDKAIFRVK
jgi:hypothetical protein